VRFSICVIEPAGYPYSHFLYNICKYLCYGIESVGCDCSILRNKLASDRVNIIVGAHNLCDPEMVQAVRSSGKYILLQSEIVKGNSLNEWSLQKSFQEVYIPLLKQADAVWDGIESNIGALKKFGIEAELLLFGYHPYMEEVIHKKNKDIEFLYCGSITAHRQKLLNQLITRGGKVVTMFDDAAMYRNDLIARARVNLAPNQGPGMNHFVAGRVLYLLNNRAISVVERSYDQTLFEHCFPWAETARWVDLCMETLNRPDLEQITEEYYERFKKIRMVDFIAPLIENFLSRYKSVAPAKTFILPAVDMSEPVSTATEDISSLFRHKIAELGLSSIIIVTDNRLDQIKKCLKGIRKHTPETHEIIFVDNASTDGTVKWLQAQVKENKNYRLIENKEVGGYSEKINQGISQAQGEYILLLDQSVLVGPGWLDGMLDCLKRAPDSGIVGPMTNRCRGPQQVVDENYRTADYLEKYTAAFRDRYRYRRIPSRNLDDFCLFFKRNLVETIGLFDERFVSADLGVEDFCLRAALEGHKNYIAGDVFVHHFSNRSALDFKGSESPTQKNNRHELEQKWTLSVQNPLGKKLAVLRATEVATDLYHRDLVDRAVEALIDCIKVAPEAEEIYYTLARIFVETKKFAEALEVFESMPESVRENLKGMACAGYGKEGLGLDDEAAAYTEKMLLLDKTNPVALNLKGVLAYKKCDMDTAVDFFNKAIASDQGYGEPYTNIGVIRWAAGAHDEALDYFKKGFIYSPSIPDHSSLFYSATSSLGRFSDVEVYLRDAGRLLGNNKNLLYLYIDTLVQQGKGSLAIREIEDAIVSFGIDDGLLKAALSVREQVGPRMVKRNVGKASASLCMIVKNEEQFLPKCLKSVRDVVDEMIVVDTGSTDKTKDLATVFGARVFDFPWTGDFSAARNYSLAQAEGDWVLILDADEVISSLEWDNLLKLTQKVPTRPVAYTIVTRNYVSSRSIIGWMPNDGKYPEEAGLGWIPSPKVRLFTRRKNILFSEPVHELVEPSLVKAKIPVHMCDVIVHHYGKLAGEQDLQKGEEYYLLGKIKYEKDPTNLKFILELGKQAMVLKKYEEAIELWLKLIPLLKSNRNSAAYQELASIAGANPEAEAYMQLSSSYCMAERFDEALAAARSGMEYKMTIKEFMMDYALIEMVAGSPEKAFDVLKHFLIVADDYPAVLLLLAALHCIQGQRGKAEAYLRELLQKGFNITPGLNRVAKQFYLVGKEEQARFILDAMIENKINDTETMRLIDLVG